MQNFCNIAWLNVLFIKHALHRKEIPIKFLYMHIPIQSIYTDTIYIYRYNLRAHAPVFLAVFLNFLQISRDKFVEHLDKRPGIHLKALNDNLISIRNDINSKLEAVVVQSDLGQFISHITELKQKVQQQEQLIQTLQGHQAANGTPANSSPSVIQAKVQALELKTGTFEGIVTTLHREIERCITAIENVERGRQSEKQVVENLEKKIRALERSISLKVGLFGVLQGTL